MQGSKVPDQTKVGSRPDLRANFAFNRGAKMKTSIAAILLATALSAAAGDVCVSQRTYPSGFRVALERGGDLYDALPAKYGNQLAAQPIALQPQDVPQIMPICSTSEDKALRQVSISAGFIDLVNHLSHAKAIERLRPGFFDKYVQELTRVAGDNFTAQPPPIVDERFWKEDILNEQASYFNQMVGLMVAINFSHHYLGHFDKYATKMFGPGKKAVPINDLLKPAEWEASVKYGVSDALSCSLATDGAIALFEAIDKMPKRPHWTEIIVPKGIDLKKLILELTQYEKEYYRNGCLKLGLLDKFQFRPAWDQSPVVSLTEKTFNGGASLLAVVQRPMIDIHADELISQVSSHVPGVLQGVGHGLGPVVKAELDAVGQNPGNN